MRKSKEGQVSRPVGPTCSIPVGGAYFYQLGRSGSYRAAQRGDLVIVNLGSHKRVAVDATERKLLQAGSK
jgi:hypothetical protein